MKTRVKEMTEAGSGLTGGSTSVLVSQSTLATMPDFVSWSVQALLQARLARSVQSYLQPS